jgi:hypothetical protein
MKNELLEDAELDEEKLYPRIKKRSKPFPLILEAIKIFLLTCVSNFNFIIYIFIIIAMIQNGDLVNLVYPLSIFAYAIYEECRPSSKYWNFLIIYSLIIIIIKFIIQTDPLSNLIASYNEGAINDWL